MKSLVTACSIAVWLLVSGCAGGARALPPLPNDQGGALYQLGAGDALKLTVFGEPDLSGTFKISDNGAIVVPLIGQVAAQGLSVPELQKRLVLLLSQKAVKSPDVTLQI